jgi:RarD protein
MNNLRYRLQIVIAMVAFGSLGVFVKHIGLTAREIALWRAIIASVVIFIHLMAKKRMKTLLDAGSFLPLLICSGVAMGFNWILLFEAYNHTSVALSTLSYYFAPTLVVIASAVYFKESLGTMQIVWFLLSSAGIVLIIGVSGGGSNDTLGILYGLGAAFLYATVVLCNKIAKTVDGITRTWIQFVAAAVVLIPYVGITQGYSIGTLPAKELALLGTIGVVHTGIVYVLYFTSLAHVRGQQVAILSYIDPVVAVLLSVFVLGEHLTMWQLAGGLVVLFATAMNEMGTNRKKSTTTVPLS